MAFTVEMKKKFSMKAELKKNIQLMDRAYTKVGFPVNGIVNKQEDSDISSIGELAAVAFFNEVGTIKIPPRPFMETSYNDNLGKIKSRLYYYAGRVQLGKINPLVALGRIGAFMAFRTQDKIVSIMSPGNSESTKRQKKGADNPLINTGTMLQSVQHVEGVM